MTYPPESYTDPTSHAFWVRRTEVLDAQRKRDLQAVRDSQITMTWSRESHDALYARASAMIQTRFDCELLESWKAHRPEGPRPGESIPQAVEEAMQREGFEACHRPPEGWSCSRARHHEGPCAASHTKAEGHG